MAQFKIDLLFLHHLAGLRQTTKTLSQDNHLHLGLHIGLVPSGFHLILPDSITVIITGEEQILKLFAAHFSPFPCYLLPLVKQLFTW
jgi:hypothetical protein